MRRLYKRELFDTLLAEDPAVAQQVRVSILNFYLDGARIAIVIVIRPADTEGVPFLAFFF